MKKQQHLFFNTSEFNLKIVKEIRWRIKNKYLLLSILIIFSVRGFAQVPAIYYFFPGSGPIGTTVTIYGGNFDSTANNNSVFFGGVKAAVLSASPSQLKVKVPYGTDYRPISITTTINKTAYSGSSFYVTFSPDSRAFRYDTSSFATMIDFTTGLMPSDIATGDFNNDGKPDLAVTNKMSNTISLFKNTSVANGTVLLEPKIDFTTGVEPSGVSIADINGDGKLDMVVTNRNSNTFSVFKNNSNGVNISFANKVDFTTMGQPSKITTADFDFDGLCDIAIITGNIVSLFKNTGNINSINFSTSDTLVSNGIPVDLISGNFQNYGGPSIAVVNSNSNTISVFRNNSTINNILFDNRIDLATGLNPTSIAKADLQGAYSLTSLVVTNAGDNSCSVFKKNDNGYSLKVDYSVGNNPFALATGDLSGNGLIDILAISQLDSKISILQNDSANGFFATVDYNTGNSPSSIEIIDLNADSKPEIVTTNSNGISIRKNTFHELVPIINSFSPQNASIGQAVTIKGKRFNNSVSKTSFGGSIVNSFSVINDSTIIAYTGSGADGSVRVCTGSGFAKLAGFKFNQPRLPLKIINTIAGKDSIGYAGNGGIGLEAVFNQIGNLCIDTSGQESLYINDQQNFRIRKVNLSTGIVSNYAGNGTFGNTGDGGLAIDASITIDGGSIVDKYGNLYFTNWVQNSVRKVDAITGIISTVAGGGGLDIANGISALDAFIPNARGLAFDNNNNLYIENLHSIIKVDGISGIIQIIAGDPSNPDQGSTLDSIPAINARLYRLGPMIIDKRNNIFLTESKRVGSDFSVTRIRKIDALTGLISTIAGNNNQGSDYEGDGGLAINAQVGLIQGLSLDTSNQFLYFSNPFDNSKSKSNRIRSIDLNTGIISIAAGIDSLGYSGDGGDALLAKLYFPSSIAIGKNNKLYFVDAGKYIRRIADANNDLRLCPGGSTTITTDIIGTTYQWQLALSDTSAFTNITDNAQLAGSNTATLSLNNIPSSWYGYKFRCVINGNNDRFYLLKFENVWTGAMSNAWENAANWSCGSVPDANTDVVINNGNVVIGSNVIIRTLRVLAGATVTVNSGYTLTITH
jgi:FG-GAP-like repeat/IPT/TIG domain